MSNDHFTLYAWRLSWYSAKVRSYLQYKGIPFNERKPTLYQFKYVIAKHVGDAVVPVVVSPEGEWLQDSTQIIARLEERFRRRRCIRPRRCNGCSASWWKSGPMSSGTRRPSTTASVFRKISPFGARS